MKNYDFSKAHGIKENNSHSYVSLLWLAKPFVHKLVIPVHTIAFVILLLFAPTVVKSAAKYWIGGGGTFTWTDATKWSDGTAPMDGDEIYFNQAVIVVFDHLPPTASYNRLFINQSNVSFRPYDSIYFKTSTFTIGDGNPATLDFYIGPRKDLFMGHDWGLSSNIILTPGSTAKIEGRLTIFHASSYNTDAAGAVTNVYNTDPVSGSGHFDGRIDNFGACISNTPDHLIFNDRTRYAHVNWNPTINNNHTIPAATWNPTSLVWIQWANPNINPFVAGNLHQTFGNFLWDVSQKSNLSVADTLTTINGSLSIINTGGYSLQLTKPASAGLTIGGSLIVMGDTTTNNTTSVSIDGSVVDISQSLLLSVGTKKNMSIANKRGALKHSGGTVNITDGMIISDGCSYTCTNSPFINIKGNLINSGNYIADNETFTFNGLSAQFIGGSKKTTFGKLVINNAAGITLQYDAEAINSLTFSNGKLSTTGTNTKMILGTIASISGAGPGKYVNGRLGIRIPVGTASKIYTIGDASTYTPVTLTFSGAATNGTGMIVAKSTSGDHPNIATTGTSGVDPLMSVNRYYTLTNAGVTFGSYSATFTFNPGDPDPGADPSIFIVQRFVPNSWYATTAGIRTLATTQFTGALQTEFGDFQVGQMRCDIPTTTYTLTGVESNCDGRSVAIGLSGSQAGVNYQLKLDGVNTTDPPVSGGGSALSFGVKILGGTYSVLATRLPGGCYSTINNSVVFTP